MIFTNLGIINDKTSINIIFQIFNTLATSVIFLKTPIEYFNLFFLINFLFRFEIIIFCDEIQDSTLIISYCT